MIHIHIIILFILGNIHANKLNKNFICLFSAKVPNYDDEPVRFINGALRLRYRNNKFKTHNQLYLRNIETYYFTTPEYKVVNESTDPKIKIENINFFSQQQIDLKSHIDLKPPFFQYKSGRIANTYSSATNNNEFAQKSDKLQTLLIIKSEKTNIYNITPNIHHPTTLKYEISTKSQRSGKKEPQLDIWFSSIVNLDNSFTRRRTNRMRNIIGDIKKNTPFVKFLYNINNKPEEGKNSSHKNKLNIYIRSLTKDNNERNKHDNNESSSEMDWEYSEPIGDTDMEGSFDEKEFFENIFESPAIEYPHLNIAGFYNLTGLNYCYNKNENKNKKENDNQKFVSIEDYCNKHFQNEYDQIQSNDTKNNNNNINNVDRYYSEIENTSSRTIDDDSTYNEGKLYLEYEDIFTINCKEENEQNLSNNNKEYPKENNYKITFVGNNNSTNKSDKKFSEKFEVVRKDNTIETVVLKEYNEATLIKRSDYDNIRFENIFIISTEASNLCKCVEEYDVCICFLQRSTQEAGDVVMLAVGLDDIESGAVFQHDERRFSNPVPRNNKLYRFEKIQRDIKANTIVFDEYYSYKQRLESSDNHSISSWSRNISEYDGDTENLVYIDEYSKLKIIKKDKDYIDSLDNLISVKEIHNSNVMTNYYKKPGYKTRIKNNK